MSAPGCRILAAGLGVDAWSLDWLDCGCGRGRPSGDEHLSTEGQAITAMCTVVIAATGHAASSCLNPAGARTHLSYSPSSRAGCRRLTEAGALQLGLEPGTPAHECVIELLTGRTHQIRAQLSAVGCPLLGDGIYQPLASPELRQVTHHSLSVCWPWVCVLHLRGRQSRHISFPQLSFCKHAPLPWPSPLATPPVL